MQQYHRMKAEHPDALVFFRMGDFYELFFDDAVVASRALEIALTSRSKDKDGQPVPMCGVPYHAAQGYIARLVRQGFRVALCEQMEDPRTAKGVVKREVVRVITPATQLEQGALDDGESSFVMAIEPGPTSLGIAWLEPTTGEFAVAEWDGPGRFERLRDEIGATRPRELLLRASVDLPEWLTDPAQPEAQIPRAPLDDRAFELERARRELLAHFGVGTLEAFGCESLPRATAAAGAALRYLRETQKRDLTHVTTLVTRTAQDVLAIDSLTRRNLELVESLADGGRRGTLVDVLDHTRTAMGGRALRDWILRPLVELERIQDRLDAVEELAFRALDRGRLRDALARVQDLDRILGRSRSVRPARATWWRSARRSRPCPRPRRRSASAWPRWCGAASRSSTRRSTSPRTSSGRSCPTRPRSCARAASCATGSTPSSTSCAHTSRGGRETIAAIEERERARTGIASLKVRFNRVFGYYIEVSRSNLALVPADYVRKQTIAGGERFITPELKQHEDRVLRADELIAGPRAARCSRSCASASRPPRARIQQTSRAAAALDVLASLAEAATRFDYVKPRLSQGRRARLRRGAPPDHGARAARAVRRERPRDGRRARRGSSC